MQRANLGLSLCHIIKQNMQVTPSFLHFPLDRGNAVGSGPPVSPFMKEHYSVRNWLNTCPRHFYIFKEVSQPKIPPGRGLRALMKELFGRLELYTEFSLQCESGK